MSTPTPTPTRVDEPDIEDVTEADRPWVVIVWNDPINLMSYVTFVFQKLFGYSLEKATKLMLDVHHKGRAVVSSGPREQAELDVFRLHEHGLWATMEHET
jgi:ATP-dependent Clp protease adaptor protein ClpS